MQQAEWDGYDNNFHPAAPALQFGPFAPQFAAQVTNTKNKNTYLKKHKKNREKYHECFFNLCRILILFEYETQSQNLRNKSITSYITQELNL